MTNISTPGSSCHLRFEYFDQLFALTDSEIKAICTFTAVSFRLLSVPLEEFPGHEVLKFPDKADWTFSFMFNVFGLP